MRAWISMRVSRPAHCHRAEVMAAGGVEVMIAEGDDTPLTPASPCHPWHNKGSQKEDIADGIITTPLIIHHSTDASNQSPNGGPAETQITNGSMATANDLLEKRSAGGGGRDPGGCPAKSAERPPLLTAMLPALLSPNPFFHSPYLLSPPHPLPSP